ncbi:MAG: hypothetical protein DI570_10945 [Phenylobacterium zucineum]|nr:MAG: hypothetical protein DI570_10945 [Phenylobacterium zucineum]
MTQRPPKKSETLEVRLPYPTKLAFMARCQADGVSASEAVRGFIDTRITPPPARPAWPWKRIALGALAAAAMGAVAVPSLARPGPDFQRLDANDDGAVTRAEALAAFDRLDADRDGRVTRGEYGAALGR